MRWFLAELAKDAGCSVTELPTIDESLVYLYESTAVVNLVLLDCPHTVADLPCAVAIRQLRPACRLALMTAFPSARFSSQAQALGIDHVLRKPIDAADVTSLFEAVAVANPTEPRRAAFRLDIPNALRRERSELQGQLVRIASERGPVGDAAREAALILQDHATREDSFALPPLGLLPILAHGVMWSEMGRAVTMAAHLTSNLPRMLEDHETIVAAVQALAQRLIEHAEMEAEVFYPATIVVGKFLESLLTDQRRGAH
jgi:hypothetical protein